MYPNSLAISKKSLELILRTKDIESWAQQARVKMGNFGTMKIISKKHENFQKLMSQLHTDTFTLYIHTDR